MKHHGRFVSPRDRYQPRCTGVLQPAATMGVFRTVEGIKFSKHSPIPVRSILTADDMENRSWSQFSRKWRRRSFYHGNQWNMIFDTREIIYGSTSRSWPSTTFFFFLFFFFFLKLNRERRPLGGLHRHTEKHQVLENHGIFKFTVIVPREMT